MNSTSADTARVKYVFLDIVGYTKNRSVEAQSDLVAALNAIVRTALDEVSVSQEQVILIPTGDGMAIALIDVAQFDIHLVLALAILKAVAIHNTNTHDAMRQFQVRVGVNENVDNVVLDINGRRNVAGHGIAMAQRIMDKADAGQIMLGAAVHEALRPRERYMNRFRSFEARGKHGIAFPIFQYLSADATGLSIETPSAFAIGENEKFREQRFSNLIAYYIAHARSNRDFLKSIDINGAASYAVIVLLWLLASDSVAASESSEYEKPRMKTWKFGDASVSEQFEYYAAQDFWLLVEFRHFVHKNVLSVFSDYFESFDGGRTLCFPKEFAVTKVRIEYPAIAEEFGITA